MRTFSFSVIHHPRLRIPPTEVVENSDSTYRRARTEFLKSHQRKAGGSFRSDLQEITDRVLEIPPTEVGGLFRSGLRNKAAERIQKRIQFRAPSMWRRLDLNHPPTSVGGILSPQSPSL